MFSILVVGTDARLLATRAAVLERMTGDVVQASPKVALLELARRKFDLAVLCHTLQIEDCIKVIKIAHEASHPVRVIQVTALTNSRCGYEDVPADAFSEPAPELLVQKAKLLMNGYDNRAV
jgi:DNA-binding response OmpR family regulator